MVLDDNWGILEIYKSQLNQMDDIKKLLKETNELLRVLLGVITLSIAHDMPHETIAEERTDEGQLEEP